MKRVANFFKDWGRPIVIITLFLVALIAGYILLGRLGYVARLTDFSFDKTASVTVNDYSLSDAEGRTVAKVLNAIPVWSSFTCDCADGARVCVGENSAHYFGDHFHCSGYVGLIPTWYINDLADILGPYYRN